MADNNDDEDEGHWIVLTVFILLIDYVETRPSDEGDGNYGGCFALLWRLR